MATLIGTTVTGKHKPIQEWKAYTHNDLNGGNLFYDHKHRQIYVIDCSGLARASLYDAIHWILCHPFSFHDRYTFLRELRKILKDDKGLILKALLIANKEHYKDHPTLFLKGYKKHLKQEDEIDVETEEGLEALIQKTQY